MTHAIIIKGRLTGPRSVELDEAVADSPADVEVIVRPKVGRAKESSLVEFLDSLPAGTRSKEDIDRQIEEERNSWGDA